MSLVLPPAGEQRAAEGLRHLGRLVPFALHRTQRDGLLGEIERLRFGGRMGLSQRRAWNGESQGGDGDGG